MLFLSFCFGTIGTDPDFKSCELRWGNESEAWEYIWL